jgi:hypothetical protein
MNALRRIFSLFSPVLALALVVGLFCALLAWKDVRDFRQQHEGTAFTEAFAKMRAQPDEAFTGLNSLITGGAWKKNFTQTAIVAVGALGMILILVSGGIDLSVGSSVAMCSVFVAKSLNTGSTPLTAALMRERLARRGPAAESVHRHARHDERHPRPGAMALRKSDRESERGHR